MEWYEDQHCEIKKNISHNEIPCGIVLTVFLEHCKRILHIMSIVILFFVSVLYSFRNIKILVIKQRIITTAIFEIMKTKKKNKTNETTNEQQEAIHKWFCFRWEFHSISRTVFLKVWSFFEQFFSFILTFTDVYEVLIFCCCCEKCSFRMRASFPLLLLHIIIKCFARKKCNTNNIIFYN